jgi:hypothetical protein
MISLPNRYGLAVHDSAARTGADGWVGAPAVFVFFKVKRIKHVYNDRYMMLYHGIQFDFQI